MRNLKFILGMLVMVFSLTSCESNDIALSYEDDNGSNDRVEQECKPFNEDISVNGSDFRTADFEYHEELDGEEDVLLVYGDPTRVCNNEEGLYIKRVENTSSNILSFEIKSDYFTDKNSEYYSNKIYVKSVKCKTEEGSSDCDINETDYRVFYLQESDGRLVINLSDYSVDYNGVLNFNFMLIN